MDQSGGYFTISDLAKELDVKKSHIRFCEKNGLIPPRTSKLKRSVYNRYDCERLRFVFHFVLLGYSKEQVLDLIGVSDADLDENDQLAQGIEFGLKKLKTLEKRKEELSFTKQTRLINEIEMLREYINKIEILKSGVPEEISITPSIGSKKQARIRYKPDIPIMEKTEKGKTPHPGKVISVFIVGLVLVILIGSYFYYRMGQKEPEALKLAQQKPVHSEKILEPQSVGPVDQTDKTPVGVSDALKTGESASPFQLESAEPESTGASQGATKGNGEIQSESGAEPIKDEPYEKDELDPDKIDAVHRDGAAQMGAGSEEVTTEILENKPEASIDAVVPERQKLVVPRVDETPKDDIKKDIVEEELPENTASAADKDTLTVAVPESGAGKVADLKGKRSLNESAKEQIAAKDRTTRQKIELSRLKSFLDEYCQAYTEKNLDKLIMFYTSDATENNKPFHELLSDYRKNMENMESLTYRIELTSYSKQTTSENLVLRGRFFMRYQVQKGVWEEKNGSIFMELLKNEDSFLIKQLNYSN